MTVGDLRLAAAKHANSPVEQVVLTLGAQALDDDSQTVEALDLFSKQAKLRLRVGDGADETA